MRSGTGHNGSWSRAWIPRTRTPPLVRDLYAAAAARCVGEGLTSHYAMVPATDPALVDAWFRLGFGHQRLCAIRETPSTEPFLEVAGLGLRRAQRADIDALARLDIALPEHQTRSPVFSRLPLPDLDETRAAYEADFDDPRFTTFVVERDGEVIGSAIACPIEVSSTHKASRSHGVPGFSASPRSSPNVGGSGTTARRGRARLGARDRSRMGRHRLADDEPPRVARLAAARLSADVLRLFRAIP